MAIDSLTLSNIIAGLRNGTLTPEAAETKLKSHLTDSRILEGADFTLDLDREQLTGIPEVVFAAGKTPSQLKAILTALVRAGEKNVLLTHVSPECFASLKPLAHSLSIKFIYQTTAQLLYTETFAPAQLAAHPYRQNYSAAIISAGTSDLRVAEEAACTLTAMGAPVNRIYDVGVASLTRLFRRLPDIRETRVAIVIAGMDGVLPSVLGGLCDIPVIAVPSSVGYGAHLGGLAPLLTMLNSCSPGVAVVNIDNGFGAAILALKMFHAFK